MALTPCTGQPSIDFYGRAHGWRRSSELGDLELARTARSQGPNESHRKHETSHMGQLSPKPHARPNARANPVPQETQARPEGPNESQTLGEGLGGERLRPGGWEVSG